MTPPPRRMQDPERPVAAAVSPVAAGWLPRLLAWYATHRRPLPWRQDADPYRVWISEVMLQQTRVETVVPYYGRFLRRFPTLTHLAQAPLQAVLKAWEGLGYYGRARCLHAAAGRLLQAGLAAPPTGFAALRALPGIGPYTAAAIASICGGQPVPVVDGNVVRVFARFWTLSGGRQDPALRRRLFARLGGALRQAVHQMPRLHPGDVNQALMELGATVCLPRRPRCAECPLGDQCRAFRRGRVTEFPERTAPRARPHHEVAVAILWHRGRVLLQQRPPEGLLGGLWEFPGGKREGDETLTETVRREVLEETGLRVRVGAPYGTLRHAYTHLSVTLTAFRCERLGGRLRLRAARAARWVRPADLAAYPLPRANQRICAWLAAAGEAPEPTGQSGAAAAGRSRSGVSRRPAARRSRNSS